MAWMIPQKPDCQRQIETCASFFVGGFFRHPIRPATASNLLLIRADPVIRGSISSGFPGHQDQLAGHSPETLPFRDL